MAEEAEDLEYYEDADDEEPFDEEEVENTDIVNYLFYICSYLLETDYQNLEKDEVLSSLEMMQDELTQIRTEYEMAGPDGGNGARDTMLEIIDTLHTSIEELIHFMYEQDDDRIESGVELLEAADLMIDTLKDTIAQQRMELTELMSRMKRGEIKEGEPIREDNPAFFLTDEELKA